METTFDFLVFLFERIVATGKFFYQAVFYSIDEWLGLYPDSGILTLVSKITDLIGLEWFTELSLFEFVFSPYGLWIIITILLVYFMIP